MSLEEFIEDQKSLLDDFVYHYRKGIKQTNYRPECQWLEMLSEFLDLQRTPIKEEDVAA